MRVMSEAGITTQPQFEHQLTAMAVAIAHTLTMKISEDSKQNEDAKSDKNVLTA
jgi:hypothetical protein